MERQLARPGTRGEQVIELPEQRRDHLVVLLKFRDRGTQARVARGQLGEQGGVFAGMVPAEGSAKSMAIQQEVSAKGNDNPGTHGILRTAQRLTQPLMSGLQFTVPGNEPVALPLTHERGAGKGSS